MQDLALQLLVVAMMMAIGLELRASELTEVFRRPGPFVGALLLNVVVFPAWAWWMGGALGLSEGARVGLLLCAAAPGGPTGPVFARLSAAHLGFATALMVSLGVVGLVSAPATVAWVVGAGGAGVGLFWPMFATLLGLQIAPLALAMVFRSRQPELASRMARPAGVVANVLLLGIIVGLLATRGEALYEMSLGVHAALIGTLLLVLLPGLFTPRGTGVGRSVAQVTVVRNLSVALLLSSQFFDDPMTDVAILCWGLWMMVLPGALGAWVGRNADRSVPG